MLHDKMSYLREGYSHELLLAMRTEIEGFNLFGLRAKPVDEWTERHGSYNRIYEYLRNAQSKIPGPRNMFTEVPPWSQEDAKQMEIEVKVEVKEEWLPQQAKQAIEHNTTSGQDRVVGTKTKTHYNYTMTAGGDTSESPRLMVQKFQKRAETEVARSTVPATPITPLTTPSRSAREERQVLRTLVRESVIERAEEAHYAQQEYMTQPGPKGKRGEG